MLQLKICDSHRTCKVAKKCLNVHEWVEVIEWNKRWSLPFLYCPVDCQCLEENIDRKKIIITELETVFYKKNIDRKFISLVWVVLRWWAARKKVYRDPFHHLLCFWIFGIIASFYSTCTFVKLIRNSYGNYSSIARQNKLCLKMCKS